MTHKTKNFLQRFFRRNFFFDAQEVKPKNIEFMINLGVEDAIAAMSEGPGVSAERVYNLSLQYQNDLFWNQEI